MILFVRTYSFFRHLIRYDVADLSEDQCTVNVGTRPAVSADAAKLQFSSRITAAA